MSEQRRGEAQEGSPKLPSTDELVQFLESSASWAASVTKGGDGNPDAVTLRQCAARMKKLAFAASAIGHRATAEKCAEIAESVQDALWTKWTQTALEQFVQARKNVAAAIRAYAATLPEAPQPATQRSEPTDADPQGTKRLFLGPTPEMIEAGAQRLVRCETGEEKWPDAWSKMDVRAARNDAERCWLSMWLAAPSFVSEKQEIGPSEKDCEGATKTPPHGLWACTENGMWPHYTTSSDVFYVLEQDYRKLERELAAAIERERLANMRAIEKTREGEKNYRRLLEESNLPIELAVEIADKLEQLERELAAKERMLNVYRARVDVLLHEVALSATAATGWIAKGPSGRVLHLSKTDGWKVEVVATDNCNKEK